MKSSIHIRYKTLISEMNFLVKLYINNTSKYGSSLVGGSDPVHYVQSVNDGSTYLFAGYKQVVCEHHHTCAVRIGLE
jgi:hypothetical protein